jgi:outer membrane protein TolC
MNRVSVSFLLSLIFAFATNAQTVLSLDGCIENARQLSPSYVLAKTRIKNSYWGYRTYRAGILPQVRLNAVLPSYQGGIERVIQPDGTEAFRNRSLAYEYLRLSVDQNVALTGGTISFSSDLQRIDNFEPTRNTQFVSVPWQFSYAQPVLLYNGIKWQQRIEPILYEESQRRYIEDLERIGSETVNLYFDALDAQMRLQVARLNLANQDTLYRISLGRFDLGKIAENDLLQIELSFLNAQNEVAQAELNLETASQGLKRYLSIPITDSLTMSVPSEVPVFDIPHIDALLYAQSNQQRVLEFRRRRLEAERQVAQAKGNSGYQVSVNAGIGRSEQGATIPDVYPGTQQQQYFTLGVGIPILDWGKNRASIRQAKANQELVEVTVQQDEIAFEQEIYLQVMGFNMQKQRLKIAAKADTIAQKRYDVTKNRYFIGKISITDLNIAQSEKDQARRAYLNELRIFWNQYYTLRRLTHYDFLNNSLIYYQEPEY